ncbi:MAG: TetR/AcrR family transcriptional regulator [Clostridia bacterium]|nr:TetR/AcrR family transcriptional regulator [Clostridia bacterium]
MPPKIRVTKDDIVNAAVELVRQGGAEAINARAIAVRLGCSTQPVFSNFDTMDQLLEQVISASYDVYLDFLSNEAQSGIYPQYKAFGMAYIRFAKEEKELFKLLFMRDRGNMEIAPTSDFDASVELIMKANGVSMDRARRMHLEMWSLVHGIATMLATSFTCLDWELISDMLTDVYQGIRNRSGGSNASN